MSDLIDRQAAIDAIATHLGTPKTAWTKQAEKWLIDLPTIDAEPVRHGHWIERYGVHDGTYYKCSVCNYNCSRTKENYCSDCGARMDGDGEDDCN